MQYHFYCHTIQRYELCALNIYLDWLKKEMDIFGLRRSGYCDEIEIKTSRVDYLADFRKTVWVDNPDIEEDTAKNRKYTEVNKHESIKVGLCHCNYFSFLMPVELADKCDVPDHAGLYTYGEINTGGFLIKEAKKAKLLHRRRISETLKQKAAMKMYYEYWAQRRKIERVLT
jgi:hypothetical protein